MSSNTGNKAALTLGTQGGAYRILTIGGHKESVDDLDDSTLASDNMEYCPGDLEDYDTFDVSVRFDADLGLPNIKVVETITITYGLSPTGTTPATVVGTGYIKEREFPEHQNNQLLEGKLTIRFDGKTGPAFTAET